MPSMNADSLPDPGSSKTVSTKKAARKPRFVPPSNSDLYVYFCYVHHVCVAAASIYMFMFRPPYLLMFVVMFLYADMYSALLHSVLDDKKALVIPGIAPVAKGFQEHHDFPMETTTGKGLLVLCSDTVRIQWLCALGSLILGRRDATTFVLMLLKALCCAYGTQFGHYYAHNSNLCVGLLKPLSWLQQAHILLPPAHHWNHHKSPYNKNFGIVSGLSNKFLNPILHPDYYQFYLILTLWVFFTLFDVPIIEQFVPPVAPASDSFFFGASDAIARHTGNFTTSGVEAWGHAWEGLSPYWSQSVTA